MDCQICGGVVEQTSEEYTYLSKEFKEAFPRLTVGKCIQCGLWQIDIENTLKSKGLLYDYYKIRYRENDDPPEISDKSNIYWKRGMHIASLLKKHDVQIRSCFEKGAGYGFNLLAIMELYPNVKLYSDEPDNHVRNFLSKVQMGDLKEERKYDLIIMSHVFEHLLDCNKTMDLCYEHLENDGLLYLEVPNSLNFIEPHVTFWTPDSLYDYYTNKLRGRFEAIEFFTHGYPYRYSNKFKKVFYKCMKHIIPSEKAMNVRMANGVFLTMLLRKR